jgi:hypothetical protein
VGSPEPTMSYRNSSTGNTGTGREGRLVPTPPHEPNRNGPADARQAISLVDLPVQIHYLD